MMATAGVYRSSLSRTLPGVSSSIRPQTLCGRRYASSDQTSSEEEKEDLSELEPATSLTDSAIPEDVIKSFDPVKNAQARERKLPSSRCVYQLCCSLRYWME